MANAISVRLDDDAVRALHELEATGLSRSEAVREALTCRAVADLSVEDPPLEEVMREVFQVGPHRQRDDATKREDGAA